MPATPGTTRRSSGGPNSGWSPVPAREVVVGDAVWVNGRWCTARSAAEVTEPGLVSIALTRIGLVHLPSNRIITVAS